jgi:hypothetical protein
MPIPPITIYAILVWFLWGFFMAIGWALGTWVVIKYWGAFGVPIRQGARRNSPQNF